MLLLSICIPTNGRIELLKNTLDSIFSNCFVPVSEFEVVISDNSSNDEVLDLLENFKDYPNIIYSKSDSLGFLNSINALKLGNGEFLKLHNNYTMFDGEGLAKLISFIKNQIKTKPLIFLKNTGVNKISKFDNFDDFCSELTFWNTWSTGFTIWRSDFVANSEADFNLMFPHVTLQNYMWVKSSFIINEHRYFINQEVEGKGGYNLFKTFAVDYLEIMNHLFQKNIIKIETFNKIKNELFFKFLVVWYFNTKIKKNKYTFDLSEIKKHISVYYGGYGYFKLLFFAYFLVIKKIYLKIIRLISYEVN
jgi:abequosyltransferase